MLERALLCSATIVLSACSLLFDESVPVVDELSPAVEACGEYNRKLQSVLECSGDSGRALAFCADLDDNCDYAGYFSCLTDEVSCENGEIEFDNPSSCPLNCGGERSPRQACNSYRVNVDEVIGCGLWTDEDCNALDSIGCNLDEFFACLEVFSTCDVETHLRCAVPTNCARGLETYYACDDFQKRTRRLPCAQNQFFGSCGFTLQNSCESRAYYECLADSASCGQGFLTLDPNGSCNRLLDCQQDSDASGACRRYRASLEQCRPDPATFNEFLCDQLNFAPCDLTGFFDCLSDNIACTEDGPRTLYEGCVPLAADCPEAARTVGACQRAADAIESDCGNNGFTPRFDCFQEVRALCDQSPFYECAEERTVCLEGFYPNSCFPLRSCP